MKTIVSASLAGATLLGAAARVAADTPVAPVPTYTATYAAEYKGKNLGTSEFKVTHDTAQNTYEFTSTTIAKGILGKLAAPNPASIGTRTAAARPTATSTSSSTGIGTSRPSATRTDGAKSRSTTSRSTTAACTSP